MEVIEKSIEVEAPVQTVYNQWTQFESFPQFMEGVEQVKQVDDKHLHWVAKIAGKRKEWDAEIIEQVPDEKISWKSTSGAPNAGMVMFHPKDNKHTTVSLTLNYEPEGALENMGDALGLFTRRLEGDLKRFRDFIQSQGTETGAWRGEIHRGEVRTDGKAASLKPPKPTDGEYGSSGKSGLP